MMSRFSLIHSYRRLCTVGIRCHCFSLPRVATVKSTISSQTVARGISVLSGCCSLYTSSMRNQNMDNVISPLPESYMSILRRKIGLKPKYTYSKQNLAFAGMTLYSFCVEYSDYELFFNDFDLPDTMFSWFLVIELHVWFAMLKLARMGHDGVHIRKIMMEMMWRDLENRLKTFEDISFTQRRDDLMEMYYQFCGAVLSYDEGILGDDKTLAASVWRTLFEKRDVDPRHLAAVVGYIRKQAGFLLQQSENLFLVGQPRFLPIYGSVVDEDRYQKVVKKLAL